MFIILNLIQYAQNPKSDSLLNLLRYDISDNNKLDHLNSLSWEYDNIGSYDSAMIFANSAIQLSNYLLRNVNNPDSIQIIKKARHLPTIVWELYF